jgi:hypothetical protein
MGTTNYLYQSAEGYHRREAVLNCQKNSPYIIEIPENVSDEAVDAQQRQPAPFTSLRNAKLPRSAKLPGPPESQLANHLLSQAISTVPDVLCVTSISDFGETSAQPRLTTFTR